VSVNGAHRIAKRSPMRIASDLAFHLQNARRSAEHLTRILPDGDPEIDKARQIAEGCRIFRQSALLSERCLTR
jgi:hypothetical protein